MTLALENLHATRRGDDPNWVHKCKNGKIGTMTHKSALKGLQLYYNISGLDRAIT